MSFKATASDRAKALLKAREKEQAENERKRRQLSESNQAALLTADKFSAHSQPTEVESELRQRSYGLRTLGEMKRDREELEAARARAVLEAKAKTEKDKKRKKRKQKKTTATLSFSLDDEDEDAEDADAEAGVSKRPRLGMNPEVDTSFLPDVDREEEERLERERLRKEWVAQQESMRNSVVKIVYKWVELGLVVADFGLAIGTALATSEKSK